MDFDVVIAGSGPAGASLARALEGSGLQIALVDARPVAPLCTPENDERTLALAFVSHRILQGLGVWEAMAPDVTSIEHIHVLQQGRFGVVRMHAAEEGVAALGFVVYTHVLNHVLQDQITGQPNLTVIRPAAVEAVELTTHARALHLNTGARLRCRLLVVADGGAGELRRQLGIGAMRLAYDQSAIIATVTPAHHHAFTAFERFTPAGPLAMLPMSEGRVSLVLNEHPDRAAQWMALDEVAFLTELQARFGYRLGRLYHTSARQLYPLSLVRAQALTAPRAVLIGNAANTLHPVAGQGFNLALRDVAVLAQLLFKAAALKQDPGQAQLLRDFVRARQPDHSQTVGLTDTLARVFTQPLGLIRLARSAGLIGLNTVLPAKHAFARRMMGFVEPLPVLASGLSLRDYWA